MGDLGGYYEAAARHSANLFDLAEPFGRQFKKLPANKAGRLLINKLVYIIHR